jgi:tetratricopeptide (TPR) repeat protein
MSGLGEFDKICFVLMPFGRKTVGTTVIDFDAVYDEILEPAVKAARLPEGGTLDPRRTDRDKFAASISQDMFEYLEYSCFALADITGANPNVFLELGVRYRARESGTVVIRQNDAPIPFDINQIKAFPYSYAPAAAAEQSRRLITEVLEESLSVNRVDSPVRLALRAQQADAKNVEPLLRDAAEALNNGDRATAIAKLNDAIKGDPTNALSRVKLGILLKDQGDLEGAHQHFKKVIALDPGYGEAHREKGVIESLWYRKGEPPDPDLAKSSEAELQRAIELNEHDFDALAKLCGLLKRSKQNARALECYEKAAKVSNGHPYPLLNAIKLRAIRDGGLTIDNSLKRQLRAAVRQRSKQAEADFDLPWCIFDSAEINLYLGESNEFQSLVELGLERCEHRWQAKTFLDGLKGLVGAGVALPGLNKGIETIEAELPNIPE